MKSARILLLMSVVCALCPAYAAERLRANYFYQQADSMAQIHFNAPYDLVVLRSDTIDQTGTSACWKAIFQNEEKTLILYFQNGHLSIAVHRFDLSAKDLSSGVYLYEIKSGQCAERKKLVVQK